MRRNLLFHLYPVRGSLWEWHVDELRRRSDPSTGASSSSWPSIGGPLGGRGGAPPRGPRRRAHRDPQRSRAAAETARFLEALGPARVALARRSHVLRPRQGRDAPRLEEPHHAVVVGGDVHVLLSRPALIDEVLAEHSCAGGFQQRVRHAGSRWHYSGTFFWVKHSALFSRRWRRIHGQVRRRRLPGQAHPARGVVLRDAVPPLRPALRPRRHARRRPPLAARPDT